MNENLKDGFTKFALFIGVLFFLYWFLVSLDLLSNGMNVMVGDNASELFGFADNYLASLTIGILVTVLVQSSSTTTSIIVTLVGAGALSVQEGIPMIMGANIGTSVTNSIVTLTFIREPKKYSRAFAAATVHDMFNFMVVGLFFPLEWISDAINGGNGGILYLLTEAMVSNFKECDNEDCESWTSPFKTITKVITEKMIQPDKRVLNDYAKGRPSELQCGTFLCTSENICTAYKFDTKGCTNSNLAVNDTICNGNNSDIQAEFLFCLSTDEVDREILNAAQYHFDNNLEVNTGGVFYPLQTESGVICFFIALIMMFLSMALMVKSLNLMVKGNAENCIKKALDLNGYIGILVGIGITLLVQSSSITTATLTPIAAIGLVSLENMLPLTLGANIGTTITGILASLVSDSVDGFQIAMVHLMFNVLGVLIFYPIPFLRRIPLKASRNLGKAAAVHKALPPLYILTCFIILPLIILGLSLLFTIAGTGGIIAGSFLSVFVILLILYFVYWFKKGGNIKISNWVESRYAKSGVESNDSDVSLDQRIYKVEIEKITSL